MFLWIRGGKKLRCPEDFYGYLHKRSKIVVEKLLLLC